MSFIQFHSDNHTEVLRLSKDGVWANPDIPADEAAKLVLAALELNIKALVDKAVFNEREAVVQLIKELRPAIRPLEVMGKPMTTEEWFDVLVEDIRARGNT